MNVRNLIPGIGGLAVVAALAAASALPAGAASPSPSPTASSAAPVLPPGPCGGTAAGVLACIKQRASEAVSDREATLQAMTTYLNNASDVTPSDRSNLLGQISSDETGLDALNATIQSDTSVTQAHSDAMLIVTDYRVYLLEAPKVHLVIVADTEDSLESTLEGWLPKVQTAINNSGASAAEKAAAQTALNDCTTSLAAAETASSGVSGEVIDLQPTGYPGNKPTLVSARGSVKTARTDLGDCRSDLKTIRSDLGS